MPRDQDSGLVEFRRQCQLLKAAVLTHAPKHEVNALIEAWAQYKTDLLYRGVIRR